MKRGKGLEPLNKRVAAARLGRLATLACILNNFNPFIKFLRRFRGCVENSRFARVAIGSHLLLLVRATFPVRDFPLVACFFY